MRNNFEEKNREEFGKEKLFGTDKYERSAFAKRQMEAWGVDCEGYCEETYPGKKETEIRQKLGETVYFLIHNGFGKQETKNFLDLAKYVEEKMRNVNGEIKTRRTEKNNLTGYSEPVFNHFLGVINFTLGQFREFEIDGNHGIKEERGRFDFIKNFKIEEKNGEEKNIGKNFLTHLAFLHDTIEDEIIDENQFRKVLNIHGIEDKKTRDLLFLATLTLTVVKEEGMSTEDIMKHYSERILNPEKFIQEKAKEFGIEIKSKDIEFIKSSIQWVKTADITQNLRSEHSSNQVKKHLEFYAPMLKEMSPSLFNKLPQRVLSGMEEENPYFLRYWMSAGIKGGLRLEKLRIKVKKDVEGNIWEFVEEEIPKV